MLQGVVLRVSGNHIGNVKKGVNQFILIKIKLECYNVKCEQKTIIL